MKKSLALEVCFCYSHLNNENNNPHCIVCCIIFQYIFILLELSQDNAAKEVIGKVMQNLPEDTRYEQFENEHLIHDHGARYSDYTEKLQSLYPECKF